jgi:hypothetical protein
MGVEFLKFNPDGTVAVVLISKTVTLRRPTMGEFIELRERLEAFEDESAPLAREVNALIVEGRTLNTVEERTSDRANEVADLIRKKSREVRAMGEKTRVEFLTATLQTLDKKKEDPNPDDFPAEVFGDWVADLIEHWRSRPTVPGES